MYCKRILTASAGILLFALFPEWTVSQMGDKDRPPKSFFKLRILPDKETYTVDEPLFLRLEFTNITDVTLCFPVPRSRYEEDATSGYTVVRGEGPHGRDWEHFIEHHDGSFPADEKLREEIERSWIKLAPNQIYVSDTKPATFRLGEPGRWKLQATYHPPESPFGGKVEQIRMKRVAQSLGCTPPERLTSAAESAIQVFDNE